MRREPIARPERFTRCYGCGAENPRGLALTFFREGDAVVAEFVPPADFGGYGRILHGGVTATLLDEAFGWTIYGLLGKLGMTTKLAVELHAPLVCGTRITVRGTVERAEAREAHVRAEVLDPEGRLAAVGTGVLRFVTMRAVARLGGLDLPG